MNIENDREQKVEPVTVVDQKVKALAKMKLEEH